MKRIFAMFLALAMLLGLAAGVSAAGAGTDGAAALCLDVLPGAETAVTVSLRGCEGVTNGRFTVHYDPAEATLLRAEASGAGAVNSVNDRTEGEVSLAWVGSRLTSEKTAMLTLYFQVEGSASFTVEGKGIYAGTEAVDVAAASAELSDMPFTDIDGHWAEDEIVRAYYAGLVNGMNETTFGPQIAVTRAMFVTMLHRMAGEPKAESAETGFTDVPAGKYYAGAVAWAVEQGVVKGMNKTTFAPNLEISREQMVTMLYRYAENVAGQDVSAAAELDKYSDAATVSDWAAEAVAWAVAETYISGFPNGTLQPAAKATRAQTAVILCRYLDI